MMNMITILLSAIDRRFNKTFFSEDVINCKLHTKKFEDEGYQYNDIISSFGTKFRYLGKGYFLRLKLLEDK